MNLGSERAKFGCGLGQCGALHGDTSMANPWVYAWIPVFGRLKGGKRPRGSRNSRGHGQASIGVAQAFIRCASGGNWRYCTNSG